MSLKNLLYIIYWPLIAVSLLGCESLVNDLDPSTLPGSTPKLVVESYISPQLPAVEVTVSESKTIYGPVDNQFESIKDAIVILSDGSKEATLTYRSDIDRYTIDSSDFRIEPGKSYQLTVSANNKQVKAISVIPAQRVLINRFTLDTLYNHDFKGDSVLRIRSYYQDIAGQADFYRHRAFVEFEITEPVLDPQTGSFHLERVKKRSILVVEDDLNGSTFQNDINLDGLELKAPTLLYSLPSRKTAKRYNTDGSSEDYSPNPVLLKVQVETLHVDEQYYRFHRSWTEDRGNNPFSEPSLVYSNVQGGLGCFGSYQNGVTIITF